MGEFAPELFGVPFVPLLDFPGLERPGIGDVAREVAAELGAEPSCLARFSAFSRSLAAIKIYRDE